MTAFGDILHGDEWEIPQLISVYSAQGLTTTACRNGWVLGRQSHTSKKSSKTLWEELYRPPRLKLLQHIKGKSLDELDELMLYFKHEVECQNNETLQNQPFIAEAVQNKANSSDASIVLSDTNGGCQPLVTRLRSFKRDKQKSEEQS
jgi:hypothetical protein